MTRAVGRTFLTAVLLALLCADAGFAAAPLWPPRWERQARAYARAVNVRPSEVVGATRPRPGKLEKFAPAPLGCSRQSAAEAGGVSLVPTPAGFVASAVAVRANTRIAKQQMRKLLTSFGRFCVGRSLGEAAELLGQNQMSFEVTGRAVPVPRALGHEALAKTTIAEMTSPAELVQNADEAHRLGHPVPGATVLHVAGGVFRVGPAQVVVMVADEQGEVPLTELDRLLVAVHRRAVRAAPWPLS